MGTWTWRLVGHRADGSDFKTISLDRRDEWLIGSGDGCSPRLKSKAIGKYHCKLTKDWSERHLNAHTWTIEDFYSTNGTFVNGWQLKPYRPIFLNDGDQICLSIDGEDGELQCYVFMIQKVLKSKLKAKQDIPLAIKPLIPVTKDDQDEVKVIDESTDKGKLKVDEIEHINDKNVRSGKSHKCDQVEIIVLSD